MLTIGGGSSVFAYPNVAFDVAYATHAYMKALASRGFILDKCR
jgi:hypothetical protein